MSFPSLSLLSLPWLVIDSHLAAMHHWLHYWGTRKHKGHAKNCPCDEGQCWASNSGPHTWKPLLLSHILDPVRCLMHIFFPHSKCHLSSQMTPGTVLLQNTPHNLHGTILHGARSIIHTARSANTSLSDSSCSGQQF